MLTEPSLLQTLPPPLALPLTVILKAPSKPLALTETDTDCPGCTDVELTLSEYEAALTLVGLNCIQYTINKIDNTILIFFMNYSFSLANQFSLGYNFLPIHNRMKLPFHPY